MSEAPKGYETLVGEDAFDLLEVERYEKTVVIGALVPMLKKLIAAKADFRVLEQDIRTLKERELPYHAPAEQADLYVPDADRLLDIISEGGSGYHFFGRYADRTVIRKR